MASKDQQLVEDSLPMFIDIQATCCRVLVFGVLLVSCPVACAEFNYEVQKRVEERISQYMMGPVEVTGLTEKYRSFGGFDNDMDFRDRDEYLTFDYALMKQFLEMDMIYYGLEDGMFLGFGRGWGTYREPGESGYNATNVPSNLTKHWNSCVNQNTGKDENCVMAAGASYIQCIDGCQALRKCPDADSKRNCSLIAAEEQRVECERKIKWCRQYVHIQGITEDEKLGFIPRTYYCHDEKGKFTSGNCFYDDDKKIPVNRTHLEGDYAYCGGNGEVCSNTFLGGYRSRDYDHRWRSWYKLAKFEQRPLWTDPYPFFTNLDMGISYVEPIYSQAENGNKAIFEGVLAVDYTFKQLTEFLSKAYADLPISVAICEYSDPPYIIGSSTGTPTAKKVLASNKSEACPEEGSAECTAMRIQITELSGSRMDDLLVKSFLKLQEANFPETLLSVRESDDANSNSFAVQSKCWLQPDSNLKWRIIVVMPSTKDVTDAVLSDSEFFPSIFVIGGVGLVICFILFVALYRNRKMVAVRLADWRFTAAFLLGCVLTNASTFALVGPNTDTMCMLRMWSFHFSFATMLSPLLVKIWRMLKLAGPRIRRRRISHSQAAMMATPVIVMQVAILVSFSIFDPPRETTILEVGEGFIKEHNMCSHRSSAFLFVQLVFDASLVLSGCVLSYLTRNLHPQLGESRQLILAMYNIALIGIIIVILVPVTKMDAVGKIFLQAVGVFWCSVFGACAFVIPRLLAIRDRERSRNTTDELGCSMGSCVMASSNSYLRSTGVISFRKA